MGAGAAGDVAMLDKALPDTTENRFEDLPPEACINNDGTTTLDNPAGCGRVGKR